jgi:8-oxo-dGTP pyrophosphatase MutT (NUDIX family)
MSSVKNLLKKYPGVKVVNETYNLDEISFAKQKKKIEAKQSSGAAIGVIWLSSKEVVLTNRTVLHPGWALLGGTVEKDEDFDTAFIREAMEEAGIEIIVKRLVKLDYSTYTSPSGDSIAMYLAIFEAEVKPGQYIKVTAGAKKEGLHVKSFRINELPEKMILKDKLKLDEIIKSSSITSA